MNEEQIVDGVNVISDKLVQYTDAAEKVITQYGGDAVNLGLNVLRVEALVAVFTWLFAVAILVGSILTMRSAIRNNVFKQVDFTVDTIKIVVGGVGSISTPIVVLATPIIWPIVGLFWPEAYAVHKFLM